MRFLLVIVSCILVVCSLSACGGEQFDKWTSQQAIDAFKASGLPVDEQRPMISTDYGLAPMIATEGTWFSIPGPNNQGRVMSFKTQEDLAATRKYFDDLKTVSAAFFVQTLQKDNLLVLFNQELPTDQVSAYEKALSNLK